MILRHPKALIRANDGVSIVEFALIAPTFFLLMFGVFDISYNMYANSMLQGSMQKAARDSTLEGASDAQIDARVTAAVRDVVGDATITFSRQAYSDFSDVARPEDFSDVNNDGTCNAGEPFEDANGNGTWDQDKGTAGMGGARDAVLYEATISYPRAFPLAAFIGISPYHSTTAATVLRNQPFDANQNSAPAIGNCP